MMNPYNPDGQPISGFLMDQSGHLPMRHTSWPTGKFMTKPYFLLKHESF